MLLSLDNSKLSFDCLQLSGDRALPVGYKHNPPNPEVFFSILNVSNDERVLSAIREREKQLINAGYDAVLGLRDMYSQSYRERSAGAIDYGLSQSIINKHLETISEMTHPTKIRLHFAIMELEAWFLGMYNLFQRIDSTLTVEFIRNRLNIDLKASDPQTSFYRPSARLNTVLNLCGGGYNKTQGQVESICGKMELSDFDNAKENGRCASFAQFHRELVGFGAGWV